MSRKMLWVNPSFLDYRVPLYKELYDRTGGNFHLLYSRERVPERCRAKIKAALGDNAIELEHETQLNLGHNSEFSNSGLSIPFPKGLYSLIKNVNPDVVLAEGFFQFTPWAVAYTRLHSRPLMIAYERTAHTERNCPAWRRLYRKFIGLFTRGYVVNGSLTKQYLESQGVKSDRIFTGAMCADSAGLALGVASIDAEERAKLRHEYFNDISDKGIAYIAVGQMIDRKGVRELLAGWAKHVSQHPDDRLLFVGDGPLLEQVKAEQVANPSVIFAGGVDYSQIYKYYAASDVFVIATLEDNWSLVVPEAMACSLPVACSVYNGCHPELVRPGENGVTFDPLSPESVADALGWFHGKDLSSLGARSVEIERAYNPEVTAANILNAINTLCIQEQK